jgi:glucose/arabinose dehydrogenase
MNAWQVGICVASLSAGSLAIAQRSVPMGGDGNPVAPRGLMNQPLPAQPLVYKTGEGQDIRVSVVARLRLPYGLAFLPGGDMLVAQRTGELTLVPRDGSAPRAVTGGPASFFGGESGVSIQHGYMRMALHPRFAQNGILYLSYSKAPGAGGSMVSAVARAHYADGRLTEVRDVWTGEAFFGPVAIAVGADSKLWIGVSGFSADLAQNPASLAGKVLRLNEDGSVPADNPFAGRKGWRPEIYTLGHRSTSDLVVHASGAVYLSEMGPNGGDEINQLLPGRNYGWPLVSFGRTYQGPWQAGKGESTHTGFEAPILYWTPSISVSGLAFYTGDALAQWKGDLFATGLRYGEIPGTGRLERIVLNAQMQELRRETLLADLHQRIRDVKQGPDGFLYVTTDEEQGAVLRIEPAL